MEKLRNEKDVAQERMKALGSKMKLTENIRDALTLISVRGDGFE